MKKSISIFLIAILAAGAVFSAPGDFSTSKSHSFEPFRLMSPRVVAMGGAGIALDGTLENRLMNPGCSTGKFGLSLPYMSVSLYNIRNNISSLQEIFRENGRLTVYDGALSFLNSIPGGERNFMSIDAGAGISLENLSLYSFMNADIFTFGAGDLSSNIGLDIDSGVVTTLSYGHRFDNGYEISVGLGFSVLMKNLTADSRNLDGVGVSSISDIFETYQNDVGTISNAIFQTLAEMPVSIGQAFPVSIGTRVEFPYGFSLGLALNNINGTYRMTVQDGSTYEIPVPMTLDFGFGWNLETDPLWYYLLEPTVAIDIVDIVGMFQEGVFKKGVFVDHLKMGAELNFLTVFNARCGLDEGYFTFGAGMDMYALDVDISYGVRPYGPSREGRYLDYVKLRINVGYDRP